METLGNSVIPSLLVRDMTETIHFYRNILGFQLTGRTPNSDPPDWVELKRDGVILQFFAESPGGVPSTPIMSGTLYMYPSSVNELSKELKGKVDFEWGPEVMNYGMLEFAIRDPNGYFIAFTEAVQMFPLRSYPKQFALL